MDIPRMDILLRDSRLLLLGTFMHVLRHFQHSLLNLPYIR